MPTCSCRMRTQANDSSSTDHLNYVVAENNAILRACNIENLGVAWGRG